MEALAIFKQCSKIEPFQKMKLYVFCNSIVMSLCVILLNTTKKEKLRHQHRIKFHNLQTFCKQVNNKLQKIESAQQVTAKKETKLKQKVQIQTIKHLKNQPKITNSYKQKNLKKSPKKIKLNKTPFSLKKNSVLNSQF